MNFTISNRERTAGLFLTGAVVLAAAFAVGAAAHNHWFSPRVSFHTLLMRGDGLRAGSPVLLSGLEVGHVGDISIREDGHLDVELVVLADHARHIHEGVHAVARRLFGVGDKRLHLVEQPGNSAQLPPGSLIPATEPMELLDVVETVDLGQYLHTLDRTLASVDQNLTRLGENGRVDHLFEILDKLAPMLDHLDSLATQLGDPLKTILKDPVLPQALHGVVTFTNDPALHPALVNLTQALDEQRLNKLLTHTEEVFTRIDRLADDNGHLAHLVATGDRLLADGKAEKLMGTLDRLADEKKLGALVDHLGVLADEMSRVGPQIPTLTKDLDSTLKEAVIVLKALQETWMLQKESKQVRSEAAHATP